MDLIELNVPAVTENSIRNAARLWRDENPDAPRTIPQFRVAAPFGADLSALAGFIPASAFDEMWWAMVEGQARVIGRHLDIVITRPLE